MDKRLIDKTRYLFSRSFFTESFSDEEIETFDDEAQALIDEFGWDVVFECWQKYMEDNIKSGEDAVNFANLFYEYTLCDYYVEEPYKFLANLYLPMDLKPADYDAVDIMDTIAISLLERAGYTHVGYESNPNYVPEEDDELIKEVERLMALQGINPNP